MQQESYFLEEKLKLNEYQGRMKPYSEYNMILVQWAECIINNHHR